MKLNMMNENFASLVNSLDFLYEQHERRTFSFKKTRNMTPLIKCAPTKPPVATRLISTHA